MTQFDPYISLKQSRYLEAESGEVPADAFRIASLTVITKGFQDLRAHGPAVEECMSLGPCPG